MDLVVRLFSTKYRHSRAHFIPTQKEDTAEPIATAYFRDVGKLHGLPRVIISDRDSKFMSHFWSALLKSFGIKHSMSTANHPQTDGQSERMIRYMKDMLRNFINYSQKNWIDVLPSLEFAYNNTVNATTGRTPFELDYGYHPHTPHSVDHAELTGLEEFDEFLDRLHAAMIEAEDAILRAQGIQAKYHNTHRQKYTFKEQELVWLSAAHQHPSWEKKRRTRKLLPKYYGPFRIVKKITENAYRLDLPDHMQVHPVINAEFLKPYIESPDEFTKRKRRPLPPMTVQGQEGHEELESIIDYEIRRNRPYYLVHWKDQPLHERRWLPHEELLLGAKELLEEFETEHESDFDSDSPKRKSKRRHNAPILCAARNGQGSKTKKNT